MQGKKNNKSEQSVKTGKVSDRPYWILKFSILIRAAHQVGAGVFLAAYLLDAIPEPPLIYVLIATISGGLLLLCEWMRHREIFREVAGMVSLMKILLLGAAYHGYLPVTGTVLLAFIIASVGAHAPKKVRHRLLF